MKIKKFFTNYKTNRKIEEIKKEKKQHLTNLDNKTENDKLLEKSYEVFVDTNDLKKKNISNKQITKELILTNEKTLVIDVSSKDVRNIKKRNTKKRKIDNHANLKNTDDHIIEVKNVSKIYITDKNKATKILVNVNLSIKRGDFVVLFGKSGSGKSTLLNIMSGLDRPTNGDVVVENQNLPYLSNHQLTTFRRNHIAFIFQQYHLLNNVTSYENVETGWILQKHEKGKTKEEEKRKYITSLFEQFDLKDVMNKYPHQLSGGQQQRISIMRALSKDADIIFADEPTGALDKKTGIIVMETLEKINREQHKTIIMVSHDPEVVKYAKRTIFLRKGNIVSDTSE